MTIPKYKNNIGIYSFYIYIYVAWNKVGYFCRDFIDYQLIYNTNIAISLCS